MRKLCAGVFIAISSCVVIGCGESNGTAGDASSIQVPDADAADATVETDADLVDDANVPSDAGRDGSVNPSIRFFSDTYDGGKPLQGTCGATMHVWGYEPQKPGKYPVFVYTVGFGGIYNAREGDTIAQEMAARGFVAASVEYNTLVNFDCAQESLKARCIFDATSGASAASRLCARDQADCDKGIVTGGMGEGGRMANLAHDSNASVRATWVMGGGNGDGSYTCLNADVRTLPADRLRLLQGESDTLADQTSAQQITGLECTTGTQACFRENGSGWYRVTDAQVEDGEADHCFYNANGCTNTPVFDREWAPPAMHAWSLVTNLDWLNGFVDR